MKAATKATRIVATIALALAAMTAAAVTITPTKVTINGNTNTLYPHYEISGADPDCCGIIVKIYDASRTTQYGEMEYPGPGFVTTG